MKGRLRDLTMNRDGTQNITVTVQADAREVYDKLRDADVEIEIKKHRNRRSLDANAYAWVLIDKIAETMPGLSKTDVYRTAIRDIGGVSETVCVQAFAADTLREKWAGKGIGWQSEIAPSKEDGCVNVILYYGSSTYDTKQMSSLIDHLIQDAKALGIETLTPAELDKMMQEYKP